MYKHILIICTGNSCRSPMAEALLKEKIKKYNIKVSSAGTHTFDGFPMFPLSIQVLEEAGLDISHHQSRLISKEMLDAADLVLAMAPEHVDFVNQIYPEYAWKVHLLRAFGRENSKIPYPVVDDPIGGDGQDYKACFDILQEEINRILPIIIADEKEK